MWDLEEHCPEPIPVGNYVTFINSLYRVL